MAFGQGNYRRGILLASSESSLCGKGLAQAIGTSETGYAMLDFRWTRDSCRQIHAWEEDPKEAW